jgi:chromosomal replication initiation ATPase DnaA
MFQINPSLSVSASVTDSSTSEQSPTRTCNRIIACVALDFGLDAMALVAPSRGAPQVAFARQVAMYLAHVGFALSFEAIGRAFGRDRTTVSHACHVIEDRRDDIWLDYRLATLELVCRSAMAVSDDMLQMSQGGVR